MGPSRITRIVGLGLVAAACATGGTVGCGSHPPTGFGAARTQGTALPLGVYPASPRMTQKYGIVEWRTFAGRAQVVITGYREDGSPARGVQLAWFRSTAASPGHLRMMMLDGTGATLRRDVQGTKTGSLSALQLELVHTMEYDLQRSQLPASQGGSSDVGGTSGASLGAGAAPVRVLLVQPPGAAPVGSGAVSTGPHPLDFPGGTTLNSGPQCQAAWNNPTIPVDGASCIFGAATFEDGLGAIQAIASCAQWDVDIAQANQTCTDENTANCDSDGTCNFGGTPEAAAPAPQSQCDAECLCANYPDTAQGCSTNFGPCIGDYQCSGGYTCQATPGGGSNTCQAPDGGVNSGDDAGAGAGEDAAAGNTGDDAGAGPGGDDGGSGDPGGGDDGGGAADPSGDDGGASDPTAAPTDDQIDDATTDETCASCQGSGSDLSANPQNGDVSVTSQGTGDGTNGSSGATGDQSDPGASAAAGGSSGSSGSGGSSGGATSSSSSGGDTSSGDDGSGDGTQDQGTQDQGTQDQGTQDQGTQDQGTQDQASQDQGTQDQGQDATQDQVRHHHHGRKPSGWKRLYDALRAWWAQ